MNTQRLSQKLRRFPRATEAVSALEYAILVGIVAVIVVAALGTFSENIRTAITNIGTEIAKTEGKTITIPDPE